jgi:hypothetical protein
MVDYQRAREAIFRALGTASMCWSNPEGAGVFDSSACIKVADDLLEELGYFGNAPVMTRSHCPRGYDPCTQIGCDCHKRQPQITDLQRPETGKIG